MGACRGVPRDAPIFVWDGRYFVKTNVKFFDGIRESIAGSRTTVTRGVDLVQVHTNFEIGQRIVQEELRGKDRAA